MDKREVLVGLQLFREGAQMTWFNASMQEPQTLSLPGENEDGMLSIPSEAYRQLKGQAPGTEALREFLAAMLAMLPGTPAMKDLCVMVSVLQLTAEVSARVCEALTALGLKRRNIFLQDWKAGFYYYVVNKRRELWTGDVALLVCRDEVIRGFILHIDRTVKPPLVSIEEAGQQAVDASVRGGRSDENWDKERDRLFYELLGRMFERRNITASYLYGSYFDRSWAQRSFQYLTFRRHAFQGQNLFSKGACCGAMTRCGLLRKPDMLLLGDDLLRESLSMDFRVRGKLQTVPLIPAGINWYEAHFSCEMIPDRESLVTIKSQPLTEGESVEHVLRLSHFPDRPPRGSRLRMTVYFTSVASCMVEVEDLGFGDFAPPSGKSWKRQIRLPAGAETGGKHDAV